MEEQLAKLDSYFAGKKENEKWLMILGVVGILGYVAYTSFLPIAKDKFETTKMEKKALTKKIFENNSYIRSISLGDNENYREQQLTININKKKDNLVSIKKEIKSVDKSLLKLSDMLFNEKSWSIFLDSISEKAKEQGLDVKYITNEYSDSGDDFGHILEISLGVKGNYKGIVNFMHDIEQNTLVTDIYESKLVLDEASKKINADISISVWGINK